MKKLVLVFLTVLAVISASSFAFAADNSSSAKVIAYYFHGDFRCPTCKKLEQYSREAIAGNFKSEIGAGKLEFKEVNVDGKGNEHFISDYQLYTKSLILSLAKDGREVKWKNLDKVWEYVGNKPKFMEYVKDGVAGLLKEAR